MSIASAGDNALALLTLDPANVISVDSNPAQIAALELRTAAFRLLPCHESVLQFLGVLASTDRLSTYQQLRTDLSPPTRNFWDGQPKALSVGVIHSGRFERFLRLFSARVLPRIHSPATIRHLAQLDDPHEQEAFYRDHWDTWRWRALFRIYFNAATVRLLARPIGLPRTAVHRFHSDLLRRTRHALTALPVRSNPYIRYILAGNFALDALPAYLRPEHFSTIRNRLTRLTLVNSPIEDFIPDRPVSAFNLSDIFDHMKPPKARAVLRHVASIAGHPARILFWALSTPIQPDANTPLLRLSELSSRLLARTKTPSYSALSIYESPPTIET